MDPISAGASTQPLDHGKNDGPHARIEEFPSCAVRGTLEVLQQLGCRDCLGHREGRPLEAHRNHNPAEQTEHVARPDRQAPTVNAESEGARGQELRAFRVRLPARTPRKAVKEKRRPPALNGRRLFLKPSHSGPFLEEAREVGK